MQNEIRNQKQTFINIKKSYKIIFGRVTMLKTLQRLHDGGGVFISYQLGFWDDSRNAQSFQSWPFNLCLVLKLQYNPLIQL